MKLPEPHDTFPPLSNADPPRFLLDWTMLCASFKGIVLDFDGTDLSAFAPYLVDTWALCSRRTLGAEVRDVDGKVLGVVTDISFRGGVLFAEGFFGLRELGDRMGRASRLIPLLRWRPHSVTRKARPPCRPRDVVRMRPKWSSEPTDLEVAAFWLDDAHLIRAAFQGVVLDFQGADLSRFVPYLLDTFHLDGGSAPVWVGHATEGRSEQGAVVLLSRGRKTETVNELQADGFLSLLAFDVLRSHRQLVALRPLFRWGREGYTVSALQAAKALASEPGGPDLHLVGFVLGGAS